MFNINYENIIRSLLPPDWRKPKTLAFIFAPIRALSTVYNLFKQYRDDTLELLKFNSTHASFEYILNKKFNSGQTGIVITTNEVERNFVYNANENAETLILYNVSEGNEPLYLTNIAEAENIKNFTVSVPAAIQALIDENELRGLINFYKLAGMSYNIIYA